MEQKLGLGLEQRLSQKLLQKLRLELKQRVGNFERQILKKVQFIDIDTDAEENEYHLDMLRTLVVRESEQDDSLLGKIIREKGHAAQDIQKITVESFEASDVSMNIGTKRNVDVMTLTFDGDNVFTMTVSMDKEYYQRASESPSIQEAATLQNIDTARVPGVQRYHGSTIVHDERGIRGLVCKEFLEGTMLANCTHSIDPYMNEAEKSKVMAVAYQTGAMIANFLSELSGVPRDSNALNIIINHNADHISARYCDTEEIVREKDALRKEIELLKESFGQFGNEFVRGIEEHYTGDLLK